MLKLYSAKNSTCSQKVLLPLSEKGLFYESRTIDLSKNEQFAPWYRAINPKGTVPTLDHDGNIIVESTLICEYLDQFFPRPALMPYGSHACARARLWSKAVDEGLFEATREISVSAMFRETAREISEEQRHFLTVSDPEKRSRLVSAYEDGVESDCVFHGIAAFEQAFSRMEQDLGEGGWLVGSRLTLADINMIPFVARLSHLELLDIWTSDRPATRAWWARVQELPSYKSVISENLSKSDLKAMRTSGRKIRESVARRRHEYLEQAAETTMASRSQS